MAVSTLPICPHCDTPGQTGLFCHSCERFMPEETGTLERVTYNRRFFGDYILEGLLFILTLGVGWLIWLYFTAQTSQTPAKRLLNVYILDSDTGRRVSAGKVWIREIVVKLVLVSLVNAVTGVAGAIDGLWVFFDRNRQTLHDKVVKTVVVYAPAGLPAELAATAAPRY